MTGRTKRNGPRAVAAATEAKVVHFPQGTALDSPSQPNKAIRPDPHDFQLGVIWEREHRGELIQFSISELNGSRFADLRRHYRRGDAWLPSPKGCTMPLSGLQGFHESLGRYLAASQSEAAQNAA